jgi:hypothetical protein
MKDILFLFVNTGMRAGEFADPLPKAITRYPVDTSAEAARTVRRNAKLSDAS